MCAVEHFQNSGYLLGSIWLMVFCSKLTAALYPLYMIWAIHPYNEHEEHPIPEFLAQFSLCQNTGISALLAKSLENNSALSCVALILNPKGFQRRNKWELEL